MEAAPDKLMDELRAVIADAEELLKVTADQGGAKVAEVRARTEESLRAARARLEDAGHRQIASRAGVGSDRVSRMAICRNWEAEYATRSGQTLLAANQVREHPWTAVGIAAGIGLIVGILVGRK